MLSQLSAGIASLFSLRSVSVATPAVLPSLTASSLPEYRAVLTCGEREELTRGLWQEGDFVTEKLPSECNPLNNVSQDGTTGDVLSQAPVGAAIDDVVNKAAANKSQNETPEASMILTNVRHTSRQ